MDAIAITLDNIRPDRQLHYENYQVVSAMHALCGGITPNMIAVSLRCIREAVHLHFYLEQESPEDREEIRDAITELEALQFTSVPIDAHIVVVGAREPSSEIEGRILYRRYSPESRAE